MIASNYDYTNGIRFHLEDWLNGYRKNCKSEFQLLMENCSKQLTLVRSKRIAEVKDSLTDSQKIAFGISCE